MSEFIYPKSDLLEQWIRLSMDMCLEPRLLSTADRKVVRGAKFTWTADDSLTMFHAGYAEGHAQNFKNKQLVRYYLNEASRDRALVSITERINKRKFGSVGFSTYAALKQGFTTESQCIQGVTVTYTPGKDLDVDVWYRTTDILKKFAADLVFLRDTLIKPFFDLAPVGRITSHLSNATVDPGSFWLLLPHLENEEVFQLLQRVKSIDERLWKAIITRLGYYLDNREIKFDRFNRNRPFFYNVTSESQRTWLKQYIGVHR